MKNWKWHQMMKKLSLLSVLGLVFSLFPMYTAEANPASVHDGLINGDLELVEDGHPVGWKAYEDASVFEMVYEPIHGGTYSVKLTDQDPGKGNGLRSNRIDITPGKLYQASAFGNIESGAADLYIEFWNEANVRVGVKTTGVPQSAGWHQVEVALEAPEDAVTANLLFYQGVVNTGVAYFDDASFVELSDELPYNSGFELHEDGKPLGWTSLDPTSTYSVATSPVQSGNYSLRMDDMSDQSGVGLRSNPMPVLPGKLYRASAYSYNESGNSQIYLEFWNASNTRIDVQIATNSALNVWQELALGSGAPTEASYATILVYQHKGNVGTAYFDEVSFIELESEMPYNGDFELVQDNRPLGWTSLNDSSLFESATNPVYNGTHSVKMEDPSDQSGVGLRSERIPVTPGKSYNASAYSYNESGNSQIYLEFWNNANSRIETKIASNNTLDQWEQIVIDGYAPDGATFATILLYQTQGNTGVAYFDQARFEENAPEEVREFPILVEGHPRQYFTADDLPELRARAADSTHAPFGVTGKQLWESVELNAQQYLTETEFSLSYYGGKIVTFPLPPEQPDPIPNPPGFTSPYPYWTMMSRGIQDRMEVLSLAHAVTEDQAYADKAKSYMMALTEWDTWSDPTYPCGGYTCLDTAHFTLGVSMTFDILYDQLTEAEREKVITTLVEKGLEPLYRDTLNKLDHNIQTLRAAALGSGAAVLLGHTPNANAYLTRAMDYYQWYLDERMESGQQEGMLYTSYAMDNMIKAFDHIHRATGVQDLNEHPFLNDFLVRWVNYSLAPGGGGLANFSDSGTDNHFGLTMNVINSWLNKGQAGWYINETRSTIQGLTGFLYFRPEASITPPDEWSASAVFDEIGWATLRSGWENDDLLFAMISNDSRLGHNHFDQNSFQIATNRSWIAGDPGYQDYVAGPVNDFTVRMGHNTIQVDGQGQQVKGNGTFTEGLLAQNYDYIKGSAAGAYSNPSLTQFDRHVVFMKEPGYFVMMDDLKADEAHQYDWMLYSGGLEAFKIDGESMTDGETKLGHNLYLRNDGAELAATFLSPAPLPMTIGTYPGAESYGYHTKVGSESEKTDHQFLTVMKVRPYHTVNKFDEANVLPLADSSGREVKLVQAAGSTVIFYRGSEAGDYMTIDVNVAEEGTYTVRSNFLHSPVYGQVQVYVNDVPVGSVYDGYASDVLPTQSFTHGDVHLSAGEHTIRYEVVGKHDQSGNYFIGLDYVQLLPEGYDDTELEELEVKAEYLQAEGGLGALVDRNDASGIRDKVIFRMGADSYELAGVQSDAEQVVVSQNDEGDIVGYTMTRGTFLHVDGQVLLTGDSAFSASVEAEGGVVELQESQTIGVYAPAGMIHMDGLQQEDIELDHTTATAKIALEAGRHDFQLTRNVGVIQQRVAYFEAEGGLANENVVRALNLHLTAVGHLEQQGIVEKVAQHMRGFKVLLDQFHQDGFITEQVYQVIAADTGALVHLNE